VEATIGSRGDQRCRRPSIWSSNGTEATDGSGGATACNGHRRQCRREVAAAEGDQAVAVGASVSRWSCVEKMKSREKRRSRNSGQVRGVEDEEKKKRKRKRKEKKEKKEKKKNSKKCQNILEN